VPGERKDGLDGADHDEEGEHPPDRLRGERVVLGLLDLPAAYSAHDARDDLGLGELLVREALLAFQDRQHLVVVAAVQFHLGQFDDAVGDPEAGDVRGGVLVVAARREEAAQFVAAEFGHDHADDAAAPALDLDARVAPVGRQVAVLHDGGPAAVLDPQQSERRVMQRPAVGPLHLLKHPGVR
jgi:hypothetical protein